MKKKIVTITHEISKSLFFSPNSFKISSFLVSNKNQISANNTQTGCLYLPDLKANILDLTQPLEDRNKAIFLSFHLHKQESVRKSSLHHREDKNVDKKLQFFTKEHDLNRLMPAWEYDPWRNKKTSKQQLRNYVAFDILIFHDQAQNVNQWNAT